MKYLFIPLWKFIRMVLRLIICVIFTIMMVSGVLFEIIWNFETRKGIWKESYTHLLYHLSKSEIDNYYKVPTSMTSYILYGLKKNWD
jgi:hypothetical protein